MKIALRTDRADYWQMGEPTESIKINTLKKLGREKVGIYVVGGELAILFWTPKVFAISDAFSISLEIL